MRWKMQECRESKGVEVVNKMENGQCIKNREFLTGDTQNVA